MRERLALLKPREVAVRHRGGAFRSAFKSRRCLDPADGFYEWKKLDDGSKQPYCICLADRSPFAFAGLWESSKDPDVTSCTIVSTEPNEVAGEIHSRMPVILPPEDHEAWLSSETAPANAQALLRPYEGAMNAYPVSKDVGTPKNDRPDLIGDFTSVADVSADLGGGASPRNNASDRPDSKP